MAHAEFGARSRRNGYARGALKSRANDVLDDFEELKKDISKLADAAGDAARHEVKSATTRLERIGHDLRSNADERVHYVSDQVRSRPGAAIGVSLGVGFLLGIALTRR